MRKKKKEKTKRKKSTISGTKVISWNDVAFLKAKFLFKATKYKYVTVQRDFEGWRQIYNRPRKNMLVCWIQKQATPIATVFEIEEAVRKIYKKVRYKTYFELMDNGKWIMRIEVLRIRGGMKIVALLTRRNDE